jgi:hypothetical protein
VEELEDFEEVFTASGGGAIIEVPDIKEELGHSS